MNEILRIDESARLATVQPGVINGDLAAAVAEKGLWYVPDPGSRAISSIGGNLATNAGGTCCAKYGVTADHVARIKAVLPDGRIIHTGAETRKNVAGLNLTQVLVGSEGTLAVIVEATVRLRAQPSAASTVVASFPTTALAIDAVLAIRQVADPCLLELMDRTTIAAVNDLTRMGLDDTAGALLLIQCDGGDAAAEPPAVRRRAPRPAPPRCTTPPIRSRVKSSCRPGGWRSPRSSAGAARCSTTSRYRSRRCRACWPRSRRPRPGTTS